MTQPLDAALTNVAAELDYQDEKWGVQDWPDGTSDRPLDKILADEARRICDEAASSGHVTWKHILSEEVMEAYAEVDPRNLRQELIQVAAVALQWVRAIDRRES